MKDQESRKSFDPTRVGRRVFIRRLSLAAAGLPLLSQILARTALAQSKTVTFASYGGSYNDNLTKSFLTGFEQKTGIKVNLGANAALALAKLQATTNPAQWDIVELDGPEYEVAVKQNLLLPYDFQDVDQNKIPAEYRRPFGVKYALFLFVLSWDQRKIPDDKAPKTWAEFWDTGKYPGKRSMNANISDGSVLEVALLADGVPIDKLYPLDVDRALKSLDRLGKKNIIWHTTNQEPVQHLTSGEVALATSFNGRIIPANRGGAKLGFTPEYGAVSGDYLGVMKNSKNAAEAFKLINYMISDAKACADYMQLTTYTSPNIDALKLVPKELADTLPTSPLLKGKVFVKDDAWWADNLEKTAVRFKEWQLQS
jgi:putative spermidine/putrescine transport system substrate-binding protein